MRSLDAEFERDRKKLAAYLSRNGLKRTRQRDAILNAFLVADGHITSERLHERVRKEHPEIGAATVYRTLRLFCDAEIANAIHFRDDVTVYERRHAHHDHLICLGCGEILEFRSEEIEKEQATIAEQHGYRLTRHRHHLFGWCRACQAKGLGGS
jgi:Fur family ferric uptake transcriptional regulator